MTEQKIKELLAVLDLPEEKQAIEIAKLVQPKPWFCKPIAYTGRITQKGLVQSFKCEKCGTKIPRHQVTIKTGWHAGFEIITTQRECSVPDLPEESLADLAFRLRDEVKDLPNFAFSKAWHLLVTKAMYQYNWNYKEWMQNFEEWTGSRDVVPNTNDRDIFALYHSRPIHWIIAALVAKALAEEKKE